MSKEEDQSRQDFMSGVRGQGDMEAESIYDNVSNVGDGPSRTSWATSMDELDDFGSSDQFNVTVSADYGSRSNKPQGKGSRTGINRDRNPPSESSHAERRSRSRTNGVEDWDTKSWYDNVGDPSELPGDSPMKEIKKTYYRSEPKSRKENGYYDNMSHFNNFVGIGRNSSQANNAHYRSGAVSHELDELDDVDLNIDGNQYRQGHVRNAPSDLGNVLSDRLLNVPRGIRTDHLKNIYKQHWW